MKKSLGPKTILFPTPVLIVGTYDAIGKPNAAAVAWGGICCSRPVAINISLRRATYTHGNIMSRQAFTVNIPPDKFVKEADYFGIASGRKVDKFEATGLTSVASDLVDAPYIQEFPLILECKLINTVEIGSHTQFIGEVLDVKAEKTILDMDGMPDVERIQPFCYISSNRTYYNIGPFLAQAFSVGQNIV